MTDHVRSTWVDLDTNRETRNRDVFEAWQESGRDLVSNCDAIELPADEVADICPDAGMYASVISPHWLAGPDGTLSYMDLVFRSAEYELYRLQRDRVLENHADGDQLTLLAAGGGSDR